MGDKNKPSQPPVAVPSGSGPRKSPQVPSPPQPIPQPATLSTSPPQAQGSSGARRKTGPDPSKDKLAYFKDNVKDNDQDEEFDPNIYYYHRQSEKDAANKNQGLLPAIRAPTQPITQQIGSGQRFMSPPTGSGSSPPSGSPISSPPMSPQRKPSTKVTNATAPIAPVSHTGSGANPIARPPGSARVQSSTGQPGTTSAIPMPNLYQQPQMGMQSPPKDPVLMGPTSASSQLLAMLAKGGNVQQPRGPPLSPTKSSSPAVSPRGQNPTSFLPPYGEGVSPDFSMASPDIYQQQSSSIASPDLQKTDFRFMSEEDFMGADKDHPLPDGSMPMMLSQQSLPPGQVQQGIHPGNMGPMKHMMMQLPQYNNVMKQPGPIPPQVPSHPSTASYGLMMHQQPQMGSPPSVPSQQDFLTQQHLIQMQLQQHLQQQQQQQLQRTQAPQQRPTAQQLSKYPMDRFGLLGLLNVIRMTNPDLNTLALGIDLTTLGLNLNSPDCLYATFISPFANCSPRQQQQPEFYLPHCYFNNSPPLLKPETKMNLFSEETLLFIFYSMPKDELQLLAAKELYRNEWRFHKELKGWIKRVPGDNTVVKTDRYERGLFVFFDAKSWEMQRKENFVCQYSDLEQLNN